MSAWVSPVCGRANTMLSTFTASTRFSEDTWSPVNGDTSCAPGGRRLVRLLAAAEREQRAGHQAGQDDHGCHDDDAFMSGPHRTMRAAPGRTTREVRGRTSSVTIVAGANRMTPVPKGRSCQPLVTPATQAGLVRCRSGRYDRTRFDET